MAKKKEVIKSETLNEVIRIKIQDKDINSSNLLYLYDDEKEKDSFPQIGTDKSKNGVIQTTKTVVDNKTKEKAVKRIQAVQKSKILINESELIRILKTVNANNLECDGNDYPFVSDLVILKVGRGSKKYRELEHKLDDLAGVLYINHIPYKRIVCASGHNRAKKVMMVRQAVHDKVLDIALCEIDRKTNFLPSKFNAYFGLMASDSKVVSMPNIVVIDDYLRIINGVYDVVTGDVTKEIKGEKVVNKKIVKDVIIGHGEYSVKPVEKDVSILPFDGAGLVDISLAEIWKDELKLDYVPASFQFRCIPAIKGNLFTFDIKKFAEIYGVSKLTDIWGREWDLLKESINCIMTRSQFKFASLYNSFDEWKTAFDKDLHDYHRTFNISEFAVACDKPSETSKSKTLKNKMVLSYQPLQTLNFTDDEIKSICQPTVDLIKNIHINVDSFLRYRGIEDNDNVDWSIVPPYYKALKYNHSLFNDQYIKGKIESDLKSIKKRAYVGKLFVDGNYQTLTPDIFGLAQYAFGLDVTGLLKANEIYSNYWNNQADKGVVYVPITQSGETKYFEVDAEYPIKELDLIRSPHIANEHCSVTVVNSPCMHIWYQYQKTGYLTSMYDTNLLKMNSADTDGDHIAGIYQKDIISAARRNNANTIDFVQLPILSNEEKKQKKKDRECCITDTDKLIECDATGFQNDIGSVVNQTSILWSIIPEDEEQKKQIQDYIKIMSVIDSLVIDFVKTGEKAEIPPEINKVLSKYKKPYFMKYLCKKALVNEKAAACNSVYFGVENTYSKYSDTDCTMNRICHYMESNISDLKIGIEAEDFDFTTLLHSRVNVSNKTYQELTAKLRELQAEFCEINRQKYRDKDDGKEQQQDYQNKYRQFFSYAKHQLEEVFIGKNKTMNETKLVDYLITIFYTDAEFIKADKSILWNSFEGQMVKRAKGIELSNNIIDLETVLARAEKSKNKIVHAKDKSKVIIEPLKDKGTVVVTEPEIKMIRKLISTENKYYDEVRRYFLVLLVVYRKLNLAVQKTKSIKICKSKKNQINYSQLNKLADVDGRHVADILKVLQELQLIDVDTSNIVVPKIGVVFDPIAGKPAYEIDDINIVKVACKKQLCS